MLKMKSKNLFALLLCLFANMIVMYAQQTGTGKMHTSAQSVEINFKRTTNMVDNSTKYIMLQNGSEIFEIMFKYDTEADTILVYWIDRNTRTISSKTVKFSSGDSKILISDYELNEITIDESPSNQIIFSIDADRQFITLYQFRPSKSRSLSFELQSIPASVKSEHQNKVKEYNDRQHLKASEKTAIEELKNKMKNYRDSVIKSLEEHDKSVMEKSMEFAQADLKAKFTIRMDSLFKDKFEQMNLFAGNDSFNVYFEFVCNNLGILQIDTTRKGFIFLDNKVRTWFRDSFLAYIKPDLETMVFETPSKTLKSADLLKEFDTYFSRVVDEADPGTFTAEITDITKALSNYLERKVNVFVKYRYDVKVESKTKLPEWKYAFNGEIVDRSEEFNRVAITPLIVEKFKSLKLEPGSRNIIEHCIIYINDQKFGPHIRKAILKSF